MPRTSPRSSERLAPNAHGVVGMSLGGLTTLALVGHAPDLVRAAVLVDVTPGVNQEKAKMIARLPRTGR